MKGRNSKKKGGKREATRDYMSAFRLISRSPLPRFPPRIELTERLLLSKTLPNKETEFVESCTELGEIKIVRNPIRRNIAVL